MKITDTTPTLYKPGEYHLQTVLAPNENGDLACIYSVKLISDYEKEFLQIPFSEALELIEQAENAKLITPWAITTKEHYWDMLECLPPENYQNVGGVNIFRMSEYYTGNITSHYCNWGDNYYMCQKRAVRDYSAYLDELKETFKL